MSRGLTLFKSKIVLLVFFIALGLFIANFSLPVFASSNFKITISNPTANACFDGPVSVNGNWNVSNNPPGQLGAYNVQIDWGDGKTDKAVNITRSQSGHGGGQVYFGTYFTNPFYDHDYSTVSDVCSPFTITVKLYHSQPPGSESGDATATIAIKTCGPKIVNNSCYYGGGCSANQNECCNYLTPVYCPVPGTVTNETCYYLPSGERCSDGGCGLSSLIINTANMVCDPTLGPVGCNSDNDCPSGYSSCSGSSIVSHNFTCQLSDHTCQETINTIQDCNDGLFCNGIETCSGESCVNGASPDCSSNDKSSIATCLNDPDNNDFTWDFRNPFSSQCVEDGNNAGHCTIVDDTITHACSVENCTAECDETHTCADSTCSQVYNDFCTDKQLTEYNTNKIVDSTTVENSISNTCDFGSCLCSENSVSCDAPQTNTYCVKDVCGAECGQDDDCAPKLSGDSCHYGTSNCNTDPASCSCNYASTDYCPISGTVTDGTCYYGTQSCIESGCDLTTELMNNYDTCDHVLGPIDTIPPVIDYHGDVTAEATGPTGAIVNYDSPATTDAVDGPGVATCSPTSGSTFALGDTTVYCDAVDAAGNHAVQTSFKVTVQDTTPPTITVPTVISVEAAGPSGTVVTYTEPSATDIVDGTDVVTCDYHSGDIFPITTTTVTCTSKDAAENSASETFDVTVQDTTPPTIDSHGDETEEAIGPTGAVVTYTSPTTHDLVDGDGTATCAPISGSTFALGDTTVTCTAIDAHSNAATPTTFKVSVIDSTLPEVTVPSDITEEATGPSGNVVTFTASASDIVDGSMTPTCTPDSGSTFALGTMEVTCTATDVAGNTGSASFNILVNDTTPPLIDAHEDEVAYTTSTAGATVSYTPPATHDLVDGDGTATCLPASGSTFVPGITTVTCDANDTAGNAAIPTTFIVTVIYNAPAGGGGGGGGSGIITCTENWSCTDWTACTGGTQTRTCTDKNKCGTTKTKPIESQSCIGTTASCIEDWTCTNWTACVNSKQTRVCTDYDKCGTTKIKPIESQTCVIEAGSTSTPGENTTQTQTNGPTGLALLLSNLGYISAILAAIIALALAYWKRTLLRSFVTSTLFKLGLLKQM